MHQSSFSFVLARNSSRARNLVVEPATFSWALIAFQRGYLVAMGIIWLGRLVFQAVALSYYSHNQLASWRLGRQNEFPDEGRWSDAWLLRTVTFVGFSRLGFVQKKSMRRRACRPGS